MTRLRTVVLVAALLAVGCLTSCDPPPVTGIWTSPAELADLPTSGPAWDRLDQAAHATWHPADLSDNNALGDTDALAGALVAVRTGDQAMVAKTRTQIMAVTRTRYARVLEAARNITDYVIAADLVGLPADDDATFRTFIAGLRTRPLTGHSGGHDLLSTALRSPNNWGTMSRAAVTAIDLYLGDTEQLATVAATHRAWLGEDVPSQLVYTSTAWHVGPTAGINSRGTHLYGRSVDGVLPEDQRRTGEPGAGPPPKGSYPWEAMQGAVVTGVLLDRAGLVDFRAGDSALARAATWLTTTNANPATGDDTWQPWVLNRVAGMHLPTTAANPGKNMAWTDWTHQP